MLDFDHVVYCQFALSVPLFDTGILSEVLSSLGSSSCIKLMSLVFNSEEESSSFGGTKVDKISSYG
jgi:hypothetical protein